MSRTCIRCGHDCGHEEQVDDHALVLRVIALHLYRGDHLIREIQIREEDEGRVRVYTVSFREGAA